MGVRTPKSTKLFAILSPNAHKPKDLKVKCGYNKNWPMGHGAYSISGNFGPLIPVIKDARDHGCDDVLWLLDDYVKEMTILNFFVLQKSRMGGVLELVTPSNEDGCIFNGVPR